MSPSNVVFEGVWENKSSVVCRGRWESLSSVICCGGWEKASSVICEDGWESHQLSFVGLYGRGYQVLFVCRSG